MTDIQRIIDAIPADVLLGVMATDINPLSPTSCLVCRLVSPEAPHPVGARTTSWRAFYVAAETYQLPKEDMERLYYAAAFSTAEVEEAIADRLNRLVPV